MIPDRLPISSDWRVAAGGPGFGSKASNQMNRGGREARRRVAQDPGDRDGAVGVQPATGRTLRQLGHSCHEVGLQLNGISRL